MVFALDLIKGVAKAVQKIGIGGNDLPCGGKLNYRLRAGNGVYLASIFGSFELGLSDNGRNLDDTLNLAAHDDRIIRGLYPDLSAAFSNPLVLLGV
ncbi:hypothetical protein D3C80_1507010 [compost metagenome]